MSLHEVAAELGMVFQPISILIIEVWHGRDGWHRGVHSKVDREVVGTQEPGPGRGGAFHDVVGHVLCAEDQVKSGPCVVAIGLVHESADWEPQREVELEEQLKQPLTVTVLTTLQ